MILTKTIHAKETKQKNENFPSGCREAGYTFKYNVLNLRPYAAGKSQSLYFLHNKTLQTIHLYQMRSGEEAYVMYLNNKIRPNQWAVFATDEKNVKFICTIENKKSEYGEITNCKDVLNLCEYTNVKFSINNHGNYWAVGSDSKLGARDDVIRQGVLLKW